MIIIFPHRRPISTLLRGTDGALSNLPRYDFFFFKRCLEERVSKSGSAPSRCLLALAENVADARASGGIRMMSAGTARRSSVAEVGREKKEKKS